MKKVYFYNSFSTGNLILVGCCVCIMAVCVYLILTSSEGNNSIYLLINSFTSLVLLGKVGYEHLHDYVIHYNSWKISFKLKNTSKTILLKDLRSVMKTAGFIELNLKTGKNISIDIRKLTTEDQDKIYCLFKSHAPIKNVGSYNEA